MLSFSFLHLRAKRHRKGSDIATPSVFMVVPYGLFLANGSTFCSNNSLGSTGIIFLAGDAVWWHGRPLCQRLPAEHRQAGNRGEQEGRRNILTSYTNSFL